MVAFCGCFRPGCQSAMSSVSALMLNLFKETDFFLDEYVLQLSDNQFVPFNFLAQYELEFYLQCGKKKSK